jgi:hypothetical protein
MNRELSAAVWSSRAEFAAGTPVEVLGFLNRDGLRIDLVHAAVTPILAHDLPQISLEGCGCNHCRRPGTRRIHHSHSAARQSDWRRYVREYRLSAALFAGFYGRHFR